MLKYRPYIKTQGFLDGLLNIGWQMEGIWFRMADKRVLKKANDLGL